MISIPSGVRVLIATRPVDFRNYVLRTIMLSTRRQSEGSGVAAIGLT